MIVNQKYMYIYLQESMSQQLKKLKEENAILKAKNKKLNQLLQDRKGSVGLCGVSRPS